jgi:NADH:ubiquinone oxidoreductase subunit E
VVHGWLSDEAILQVASVMRVTPAYLESVASFYDMLELEPVGRHSIYVCTNISCQLRGARDLLDAFSEATGAPVNGSSPDGQFRLRSFECLGACDVAPMASIEGQYRGPLTGADAKVVADHLRGGGAAAEVLPDRKFVGDFGRRVEESSE